jgi:hypothetical protein
VLLVAAASRKLADAILSITCSHVGLLVSEARTPEMVYTAKLLPSPNWSETIQFEEASLVAVEP